MKRYRGGPRDCRSSAIDPKHAFKTSPITGGNGQKAAVGATGRMRRERAFMKQAANVTSTRYSIDVRVPNG